MQPGPGRDHRPAPQSDVDPVTRYRGDLALTQNAFRGDQGFTSWPMPSREGIAGNAPELRRFTFDALERPVGATRRIGVFVTRPTASRRRPRR